MGCGFVGVGWVVGGDVAVGADGEAGVCVDDGGGFVDVAVAFEVSDGDGAGADGEWVDGVGVEVCVFVLEWECVADEEGCEFVAECVHRLLLWLWLWWLSQGLHLRLSLCGVVVWVGGHSQGNCPQPWCSHVPSLCEHE